LLPGMIWMAFLISLGSGTLGAMLGLGGGVINVPLLIFLLGPRYPTCATTWPI